jgi:AbrB family looped-hinge helix DNA binding protein
MIQSSHISSKFQITLPKQIRSELEASVGDILVFAKEKGEWKIKRVSQDPIKALRVAGAGLSGKPQEAHEEFEKGWEDR